MFPNIKIFAICGSPVKDGNTENFMRESLKAADGLENVEYEWDTVAEKNILDCNHCNWCITNSRTGKWCSRNDDMQPWFQKIADADAILLATPVYIARLSGYMANVLDRLRTFLFGNFRGTLKNKVGAALAVSWFRTGGIETALLSIYEGFLCDEILPVSVHHSGAYYGAGAFSSVGGASIFNPEEKLQVLKDDWGLKQGRNIVLRMIETARIVKAGKMALVESGCDPHLLKISKLARKLESEKGLALPEV